MKQHLLGWASCLFLPALLDCKHYLLCFPSSCSCLIQASPRSSWFLLAPPGSFWPVLASPGSSWLLLTCLALIAVGSIWLTPGFPWVLLASQLLLSPPGSSKLFLALLAPPTCSSFQLYLLAEATAPLASQVSQQETCRWHFRRSGSASQDEPRGATSSGVARRNQEGRGEARESQGERGAWRSQ